MTQHILSSSDIAAMPESRSQHQFNDNAIRMARNLSSSTGMQRIGVHLVRLESGRESTTHHYHDGDEEFLYVLSGRGVARIGDEEFEVAAGDFMGFPAPSPAHSMRNPHAEDLVYLMGGERLPVDVVHYPDIGRTMIKSAGKRVYADDEHLHEVAPKG